MNLRVLACVLCALTSAPIARASLTSVRYVTMNETVLTRQRLYCPECPPPCNGGCNRFLNAWAPRTFASGPGAYCQNCSGPLRQLIGFGIECDGFYSSFPAGAVHSGYRYHGDQIIHECQLLGPLADAIEDRLTNGNQLDHQTHCTSTDPGATGPTIPGAYQLRGGFNLRELIAPLLDFLGLMRFGGPLRSSAAAVQRDFANWDELGAGDRAWGAVAHTLGNGGETRADLVDDLEYVGFLCLWWKYEDARYEHGDAAVDEVMLAAGLPIVLTAQQAADLLTVQRDEEFCALLDICLTPVERATWGRIKARHR